MTFDQINVGCAVVTHPTGEPAATSTLGVIVNIAPAKDEIRIGDLLAVLLVIFIA